MERSSPESRLSRARYADEATGGQSGGAEAVDDVTHFDRELREARRERRRRVVAVLGDRAHQALHFRDADAEVTDRRRVVQEAPLDAIQVQQGPRQVREGHVVRERQQQHQLLVQAQHGTAQRVEQEA
jgi:hypothetical protein